MDYCIDNIEWFQISFYLIYTCRITCLMRHDGFELNTIDCFTHILLDVVFLEQFCYIDRFTVLIISSCEEVTSFINRNRSTVKLRLDYYLCIWIDSFSSKPFFIRILPFTHWGLNAVYFRKSTDQFVYYTGLFLSKIWPFVFTIHFQIFFK